MYDFLVVGAGLYGATFAEQVAKTGKTVCVIDKRSHIAGNAYSEFDEETGIEVHKYGAHLFHTNNEEVWKYLHDFTSFTDYKHKVYANHNDEIFPLPINLGTINQFFRSNFSPAEAKELVLKQSSEIDTHPTNLKDKAISLIGSDLYNAFINNYTMKQWNTNPSKLPASIISRLPVRYNYNNDYFSDKFQGQPADGFTSMVNKMLSSNLIDVRLNTKYSDVNPSSFKHVIYSGAIDEFFDYKYGKLGWRSVKFEFSAEGVSDYQGTSVINYVDASKDFTRVIEFKHFNPERSYSPDKTIIAKEYSTKVEKGEDPYYPINTNSDKATLRAYEEEAKKLNNVTFGGRLGKYKYLDMHQAISMALKDAGKFVNENK